MRVYEFAKKYKLSSLEVIEIAKENNIKLKDRVSALKRSEVKLMKKVVEAKMGLSKPDPAAAEAKHDEKVNTAKKSASDTQKNGNDSPQTIQSIDDLDLSKIVAEADLTEEKKKVEPAPEVKEKSESKVPEEKSTQQKETEKKSPEKKEEKPKQEPKPIPKAIPPAAKAAPDKQKKKKIKPTGQKPSGTDEKPAKKVVGKANPNQNKKGKKYRNYYFNDDDKGSRQKRSKDGNRRRRNSRPRQAETRINTLPPKKRKLLFSDGMTAGQVATAMVMDASTVVQKCFEMGEMITVNDIITRELAEIIAAELGAEFEISRPKSEILENEFEEYIKDSLSDDDTVIRPPVVTIMGHVDHGKTKLLDRIRNTNIVSTEHGGITQHIGASIVKLEDGKKVTFIDTPGHEAFTQMRARGAQITDIAVLIVAANDGVMPQTVEAIDHIKAAGVKMVVAINKIDLPEANPDKVLNQLMQQGIIPDDMGGDTTFVRVSAITGEGIPELLEILCLEAEMLELKANPTRHAVGYVIEAEHSEKTGISATVLVRNGTMNHGDAFITGPTFGKIRRIYDDREKTVMAVGPGLVGRIYGFDDMPEVGSLFATHPSEKFVKDLSDIRKAEKKQEAQTSRAHVSLEELYDQMSNEEKASLGLIIKSDTQGTGHGIIKVLEDIPSDKISINIIRNAVGAVTQGDIDLADANDAIVVGFNIRISSDMKALATKLGVSIKGYKTIYDLKDDIVRAIEGKLDPTVTEQVLGEAEIKQVFRITGVGSIAGSLVLNGKIKRNAQARLFREGTVIYDGKITSLKRIKEDATTVDKGYECGIGLENYNDVKVGDIVEAYELTEERTTL